MDQLDDHISQEFIRFKSQFNQLESKVRVHSLSEEFADKVTTRPYMVNPHAFEYKVSEFLRKIRNSKATSIVTCAGARLPAASAAAHELGLPLHVIPQLVSPKLELPEHTFALIGTPDEVTLKFLKGLFPDCTPDRDGDLTVIAKHLLLWLTETG